MSTRARGAASSPPPFRTVEDIGADAKDDIGRGLVGDRLRPVARVFWNKQDGTVLPLKTTEDEGVLDLAHDQIAWLGCEGSINHHRCMGFAVQHQPG